MSAKYTPFIGRTASPRLPRYFVDVPAVGAQGLQPGRYRFSTTVEARQYIDAIRAKGVEPQRAPGK